MVKKKFCKVFITCCTTMMLVTTVFAQNVQFEVINQINTSTSFDNISDFAYNEKKFIISSNDKLIYLDMDGEVLKEEINKNIHGISFGKYNKQLCLLYENGDIKRLDKSKVVNVTNIRSDKNLNINARYLSLTDSGYISYIKEGWSSRISYFNSQGKEIMSVFSPGIGKVSGLTFVNGSIWIISDLGGNKKSILRKYKLTSNNIVEEKVNEIPVKAANGLTIDENNIFYTFSKQSKNIVKFKIK